MADKKELKRKSFPAPLQKEKIDRFDMKKTVLALYFILNLAILGGIIIGLIKGFKLGLLGGIIILTVLDLMLINKVFKKWNL